ncbi:MAG: SulP family inorganic anion transporter [Alphaproteobacteria bacterium]|nr:SulP family inorganic anion transporter [Alphaproteobacteria bacterium]
MTDAARAASAIYRPKLTTVLAEGYGLDDLRKDAVAGLTVAIVAIPLSMAIAIASGVSPDRGLYTAIVGGFLVSALSGSRFQIGGPAGAFIVLVAATVAKFGLSGLALTVFLSGFMLTLVGVFRLGGLIRHIPHTVTVGFTAGIAVTIAASQVKDLFGLRLAGHEPGPFIPKMAALAHAAPSANLAAFGLGALVIAIAAAVRRWKPLWPAMLIGVAAASLAGLALHLPVATIGTQFGGIPRGLPAPELPVFTWREVAAVLPAALSFTLLGGIESLLSAVVADGMTGRQHRPNMELIGQGVANMASSLFGGIAVTGTVARTATNVRAGGRSPISGMLHAVFLLAFMVVAAPLASYIPVSALAGVLVLVCWNMAEKAEFARLMRDPRSASVLAATFGITVVKDLTSGIIAGCLLATLFWAERRWRVHRGV